MDNLDIPMDEIQTKAYQLCFVWLETTRKVFPNYKHYRMSKKGDPRKSLLFKYCYKLVKETLISDEEFPLYIMAQLQILKAITNGVEHPLISPQCLVGDKAWRRWCLWKKRYDAKSKALDISTSPTSLKVKEALEAAKAFLFKHFQGQPTFQQFQEAADNKNLLRWAADKRLSPYYLANSIWISKIFDYKLLPNIDLELYKNPEIAEIYGKTFNYEVI